MAEKIILGKVLVTLEGEHDSTRSYDKYCEVTSGGSSYVSKKDVPIGTPITDTTYWQKRASKGADGIDGTDGDDGLDAYQPFKGWYSDTTELNTSFGSPVVGDYAYVKGSTSSDPVAIYHCVTAGTWTDSGNTFNPANNQEFASGEALNVTHIVDNLNSSSATDVLSAKQGKMLDEKIGQLGLEIYRYATLTITTASGNLTIDTANGVIAAATGSQRCYYIPVNTGDKIRITATNSSSKAFRYGFTSVVPDVDVPVSGANVITNDKVDLTITAPLNGYVVLSHTDSNFTNQQVNLLTSRVETLEESASTLRRDTDLLQNSVEGKVNMPFSQVSPTTDYTLLSYAINPSTKKWSSTGDHKHIVIPTINLDSIKVKANASTPAQIAWLTSDAISPSNDAPIVSGTEVISVSVNTEATLKVPSGAEYLYIRLGKAADNYEYCPTNIWLASNYVEDSLSSNASDRPLSAKQGFVLDGKITEIFNSVFVAKSSLYTNSEKIQRYYINSTTGLWALRGGSDDSFASYFAEVSAGEYVKIQAKDDYDAYVAFTSNTEYEINTSPSYMEGYDSLITIPAGKSIVLKVPNDGYFYATIREALSTSISPASALELAPSTGSSSSYKKIKPKFIYDIIKPSTGDFSTNPSFVDMQFAVTPRFIKYSEKFGLLSSISADLKVFCYDEDFAYLDYESKSVVANVRLEVEPAIAGTKYIKLSLSDTTLQTALGIPVVTLDGNFEYDWDVFNARPTDNGYHRISVLVNVTNPNCCDEVTDDGTVLDEMQLLPDYGVICLPDTYTPTGNPTRLIIYCHGGNVNYSENATRFDTQDLEPEYWLAEGYAILDVEGNPFDNSNEHFQTPQAMDCYIAAYKWAIEHYNLKRDGVLLGGRSMGGGMTFNLLRCPYSIPVIAACPNAAHGMCIGGTTPAGTMGARQKFYSQHCGFVLPSGYTWDTFDWDASYYSGDIDVAGSKKNLLYTNWDKLVKNTPIWTLCSDLPTDDESIRALVNNHFVAGSGHPSQRVNLWSKLHVMSRCPVKLFGCYEDASCPPNDTALLYYRMLTNAAQIAEVRLFHSYKDYTGTGTTAHHYDTQDPALRASVTTKYGVTMTNIPVVYIEMLQFWRRYEQMI